MSEPEEKTVALSATTLAKIERELSQPTPSLTRVELWLEHAGLAPDRGFRLVIPSTYKFSHALGFVAPPWLLIDPPNGKIRVLDRPEANAR